MPAAPSGHETIIRPLDRNGLPSLVELWRYRELLWSLVRRQLRLDYRDLSFGVFWALARPVTMLGIFVLFKRYSAARTGVELPYPVYLYSGLIVWFFFTDATSGATAAMQRDVGLIRKIYYPRFISPLTAILAQFTPLAIAALPLLLLLITFGVVPGVSLLLLPLVLVQCAALALGIGCLFSTLAIDDKDWQRLLGLALYVGLFLSPVIYAPAMLPASLQPFLDVNPMTGTLMAIRACLDGDTAFPVFAWLCSLLMSLAVLLLGAFLFQRAESAFVDRL